MAAALAVVLLILAVWATVQRNAVQQSIENLLGRAGTTEHRYRAEIVWARLPACRSTIDGLEAYPTRRKLLTY